MKRIIIDTNYFAAFKKNDAAAVNLLRRADYIAVNTVILGELLAGFRCGSKEKQNRWELDQFLDSPRVEIISVDEETSEFYTQVFYELKQKGRPIPSNDLWLAASALQHGLALATYDGHFSHISGLLLAH
ncbi:type II toxin-antitoxin system VapC family toxin [Geobacter sp.]|uniref:type II toxin-antitoxin system VapC family toxin n=1 Tax=Geobacter sp. TaxID=46610 RepID=UPI001AD1D32F|nr:type II toxin-antitoxin system VapC family toxin [Geobacter sp.]CAG0946942.1 Ribonuclease VapC2 [Anaerolineae bacterium]